MGRYADMLLTGPQEPAAQQGNGKWSSQLLGTEQPAEAQPQQSEGWGEWIKNSVMGRQDPREAGTSTVFEQHRDVLSNPTALAANFGASDAQMGDTIQGALGDRFVRREKDANGYEVFVTRGKDGQEQRGYLNAPGLDMQDVTRGVRGALPYVATGVGIGAATKAAGLGVQALAQGLGAGATSVAGDVGQMAATGSKQGIEAGKAATMTGFGAAGPVVGAVGGALWRRFVTIPGLVDRSTGQLTAKGIEAARRAGVDPADITPDFSKRFADSYARTGNEAASAVEANVNRFGIPVTRGQVTKDPYLLTQEEGMRRRLYGEQAQNTMRGFDQTQQDAIARAALGDDPAHFVGIGGRIGGSRKPASVPADREAGTLGEGVQSGLTTAKRAAKSEEAKAWDGVRELAATKQALAFLPDRVMTKLGNETGFTKAGAEAADMITKFAAGEAPETAVGAIKLKPIQSVDQMRRKLGDIVGSAETPSDKRQAAMIYDAFNDWIGEAAQKNLLAGDPAAALKIVKARGFTKEVRELFSPRNADGLRSAAGSRLKKIENADSGEGVVQALFGAQGSRGVSDGAVEALQNLKTVLDRFAPPDVAKQAWNDVRLAYWTRLVTGKNGELVGPTAMANNIKSAMRGQSSVFKTLYRDYEQRQIAQFVRALEMASYKPPNASGSGYTAASFAKEGIMKFLDAFGLGTPARAAMDYTGIGNAISGASARNAVRQFTRPARPNVTPAVTASGSAYERNRQSGSR